MKNQAEDRAGPFRPSRFPARRRQSDIPCANRLDDRTPSGSTLRFRRAILAPILPGGAAPGVDGRSRTAGGLEKFLCRLLLRTSERRLSNDSKGLGLAVCEKTP